jgi:hypothetical protein
MAWAVVTDLISSSLPAMIIFALTNRKLVCHLSTMN